MNALLALLAPVLQEVWTSYVMPQLQKADSGIANADLQVVATAFTNALNVIAQAEIPKI